jgi:hypothetical protein
MSTVAEHLALLEFYQATDSKSQFDSEANLLVKAHLKELIDSIPADEMKYARKHTRQALLDMSPLSTDLIQVWEKSLTERG